jgi:hypothetical protein
VAQHHLFAVGRLVATPAALRILAQLDLPPLDLIYRHVAGDFGDVCSADCKANLHAIQTGLRIVSRYRLDSGDAAYVITEADRSSTCILLTTEY